MGSVSTLGTRSVVAACSRVGADRSTVGSPRGTRVVFGGSGVMIRAAERGDAASVDASEKGVEPSSAISRDRPSKGGVVGPRYVSWPLS